MRRNPRSKPFFPWDSAISQHSTAMGNGGRGVRSCWRLDIGLLGEYPRRAPAGSAKRTSSPPAPKCPPAASESPPQHAKQLFARAQMHPAPELGRPSRPHRVRGEAGPQRRGRPPAPRTARRGPVTKREKRLADGTALLGYARHVVREGVRSRFAGPQVRRLALPHPAAQDHLEELLTALWKDLGQADGPPRRVRARTHGPRPEAEPGPHCVPRAGSFGMARARTNSFCDKADFTPADQPKHKDLVRTLKMSSGGSRSSVSKRT